MLPENAFQPRGWKGGMTLEGGKGGSEAPKADPNIGLAQRKMADLASQQWTTFMEDIWPKLQNQAQKQEMRADEQFAQDKKISDFNYAQAQKAYERYEQGAIPAMQALKDDADAYNTEARREELAQQMRGDIDTQFEQQRQAQEMRRRSYGIDPTSGLALNEENTNAINKAAITAAAMNQTRQAAREIGLQKQANLYNMYAGLPAQGNANTAITLNANQAGLAGGQAAFANYGQMGSSLGAAAGTSLQGWNGVGQLGVSKYQTDVSRYNAEQQASAAASSGLGSALGTIGMAAMTGGTGGFAKSALGSLIGMK
jgi:hypothetical protein